MPTDKFTFIFDGPKSQLIDFADFVFEVEGGSFELLLVGQTEDGDFLVSMDANPLNAYKVGCLMTAYKMRHLGWTPPIIPSDKKTFNILTEN